MSWSSAARYRRAIAGGVGFVFLVTLALASCRPGVEPTTRPEPPAPPPSVPPPRPSVPPQIVTPPPPPPPPVITGPLWVRVGLASDLSTLALPCCDEQLVFEAGGETWPLTEAVRVAPAGTLTDRAVFRLQVAALKDEQQAHGLATRLGKATSLAADAVFDAGTDLYRVRVGRFRTREEAELARRRLEALGQRDSWVATEGGALEDPAFEVVRGERRYRIAGRWLEVSSAAGAGVPYGGVRYRGRLLIFLNSRGHLNVVNELRLEDYLRGVVPKEMGPELYPEIEALKAQAVAARTYAVRNLDEFAEEGFDICSTPRCQVYGGMSVEHPLSDRAIFETAGQVVLFGGRPAETLYGATCGGHTEDVEVIFPLKTGPYLRGVPCLESGPGRLSGNAPAGAAFPTGLMLGLLPPSTGKPHRVLAARMEHLALLAGLPVPRDRLKSMQRKEVLRFATSVFDLALDRRLRAPREQLEELLEEPPADWRPRDLELARYLASAALTAPPANTAVDIAESDELLFRLAVYLDVVERQQVRYLKLAQRRLEVRAAQESHAFELTGELATFRPWDGALRSAPLELLAGDRLEIYLHRGQPAAVVQPVEAGVVRLGGRVAKQNWSRFVSARQLRSTVQARYPGFPFEGFEVLSRGVSGRVGKLLLMGTGGQRLEVEGLAVRWTLDVWDNLFWAEPGNGSNNEPGWLFRGKGWGHGVGMCQAGAFGMAMRGHGYREILGHYYSGIELGRIMPVPERPRFGS